jgi:hypothetical protein
MEPAWNFRQQPPAVISQHAFQISINPQFGACRAGHRRRDFAASAEKPCDVQSGIVALVFLESDTG